MAANSGARLPVVAFFDVDKTLLHGASLWYLARGSRKIGIVHLRDMVRFFYQVVRFQRRGEHLGALDRIRDRGMQLLAGHDVGELRQLAREVVDHMHPRLWPETVALLTEHLRQGHQVWLVSATPDFLAEELAARLGATGALGSPLEIADGRFTGGFSGPTMHGPEKGVAAARLLAEQHVVAADCYAYSDSINDLPMLTAVGTAVAVNPDRALAEYARRAGWRVLRLDPASIKAERRRIHVSTKRLRPTVRH